MLEITQNFLSSVWSLYLDAGFWVAVSFFAGGCLHVFVPQDSLKKWLGKPGLRSIIPATLIGMVLPICSCGVVPLGLSLYWSGASLPAVLAFMAATPIINPAAALMALGLFGPFLAGVYVLSGFFIPIFLAYSGRLLLPSLTYAPGFSQEGVVKTLTPLMGRSFGAPGASAAAAVALGQSTIPCGCDAPGSGAAAAFARNFGADSCGCTPSGAFGVSSCCAGKPSAQGVETSTPVDSAGALGRFYRKLCLALRWGFFDLGLSVGKYIFYGILLAAAIFTLIPQWFVADYLGDANVLSYGGSVLLGAAMYVCSVGHIPVVAALMAMGASPGVAIAFLLSGVATNLPELVSLSRLIKLRAAVVYAGGLIVASLITGMVVNAVLPPGAGVPRTVVESQNLLDLAHTVDVQPPQFLSVACAVLVFALGVWSAGRPLWSKFAAGGKGAGVKGSQEAEGGNGAS